MVLRRSAQAQKHSTEKMRQSFHLVNPPDPNFVGWRAEKSHRMTRHSPSPPSLFQTQAALQSPFSVVKKLQVQSIFDLLSLHA
jgi:hypothetical protein